MGFLDTIKMLLPAPRVASILPEAAKQEILRGRLPILNTSKVFLKKGEQCHYIDKALYEKKTVNKRYVRKSNDYSMPGLFKRTRITVGGGHTDVQENAQYETIRGILYITNKRIIFVGDGIGFDKALDDLVALTPYSNCVDLQFSKENYKLFVPDGNVTFAVFQLVR